MNLRELNEIISERNQKRRIDEKNHQYGELIRICDESYLPSVSSEKYRSIFESHNIFRKLDYIDRSKNQRLINYTQFGLDSNQFAKGNLEDMYTRSRRYSKEMRSYFDKPINPDFLKLVSCYIASFPNKPIEESVDIYDEYRNIKKIFNFLPEREVLEMLLFYRDSISLGNIEDKLYSYSKMRDSSAGEFLSDSILKNILISTTGEEDIMKKTQFIQSTVLDISDIYMSAPLYVISACAIYSKNPYSVVPHYMSKSYSMGNEFSD